LGTTATKTKTASRSKTGTTEFIPPDAEIIAAADAFILNSATRNAAEKAYEKAKDTLKKFLGDDACKTLSDGRTVSRLSQFVAAEKEPRKEHYKTLVSVSPKPAA
jgi:Flp pilus assembly protein CpaB